MKKLLMPADARQIATEPPPGTLSAPLLEAIVDLP